MNGGALSDEARIDWLRLARTPRIGPVTFQALLQRFGDAGEAIAALPELAGGKVRASAIPSVDKAAAEIGALDRLGGRILCAVEPDYPILLAQLDPPPPVISIIGDAALPGRDCAAIVGSRNASATGLRLAGDFARALGEAGLAIVSGMARGVDSAAHDAALETGTIAVLAGGVDHIYPPQAEDLYRDIASRGAVISEMPIGYRATARDFPRRNRLVSGLSRGVIVVEAAARSGSLITARLAGEQGREVMAVPGSPLDPRAAGTNRLIQQGAALVTGADDVLRLMAALPRLDLAEPETPYQSQTGDMESDIRQALPALEALITHAPTHRDELARQADLPVSLVVAALVELEISGVIELEPGGGVRRR